MLLLLLATAIADTCPDYGETEPSGEVRIGGLSESSGVAASRIRPGVFFTHGDGGEPRIYAFRADGRALESVEVAGAELDDWEDIAAAPCPDKGDCLYIGDIGDNDEQRGSITVYVVREPEEGDDKTKVRERYTATYPDGAHDAEALLVHPCTGRIHVVTKSADGLSTIYRFPPLSEVGRDTVTLEEVAKVQIDAPTAEGRRVTGGDYDLDGDRVVLRTGAEVLEWTIDPEAPNSHWATPPRAYPAASGEEQGEGVAFDLDGGVVITSEGSPMPVARLPCSTEPSSHECVFPQSGCGCQSTSGGVGGAWLAMLGLVGAAGRRGRAGQRRQRSIRDQPS
mgnify:CR=1 FL=1